MTQPYDSGMAGDRPARSKPALHIAACLRVVAKHKNMPSISVEPATSSSALPYTATPTLN